jgi:hypothetical protein
MPQPINGLQSRLNVVRDPDLFRTQRGLKIGTKATTDFLLRLYARPIDHRPNSSRIRLEH